MENLPLIALLSTHLSDARYALKMYDEHKPGTDPLARFFYARAFVYALDGVASLILTLTDEKKMPQLNAEARKKIQVIHDTLQLRLPGLRGVRNSAHHTEDRVRGKGKDGKEIAPLEINTPGFGGNPFLLGCLDENDLCYTGEGGVQERVGITAANLAIINKAAEELADALGDTLIQV